MQLNSGTLLQGGKYRIDSILGQGGFGITYSAVQVGLDRVVAIKEFFWKINCSRDAATSNVIVSDGQKEIVDKFRQKFVKEAQTIAALNNPHVVKIYDVFEENGTAYYVMEMLEPDDLSQRIPVGGFSEAEAVRYVSQIGDALTYVHKRNILHLDVKPSNVMFRNDGEAVLIDFGVSKRYDKSGGQTSSTPVGVSKGYAPIEQFNQQLSSFAPATDVYSLTATLYKLLTGKTPPDASMVADDGLPSFPKKVSANVAAAVEKGMSPRRADRPQTVEAFLKLLTEKRPTGDQSDETVFVSGDETVFDPGVVAKKPSAAYLPSSKSTSTNRHENEIKPKSKPKAANSGNNKTMLVMVLSFVVCLIAGFFGILLLHKGKSKAPRNSAYYDFTAMGMYPMVKVTGGTFTMGSDETDEIDCPAHRVTVDDFYIGQFEVTQKFWKSIMETNPSINDGGFPVDSLPVDNVSHEDVLKFIGKLNAKTGRTFSLPTEAQWEYAARGGHKSSGKSFAGSTHPRPIWFDKGKSIKVKKSDSVNELEIYQMSGNVAEWCLDKYDEDFYSNSIGLRNPVNRSGDLHVVRGGSYDSMSPEEVTVYYREADSEARPYIGFRLVLNNY